MAQPKIFVINLLRSEDRREQTRAALRHCAPQLDCTFFPAVDAKAGEHLAFSSFFRKTQSLCYKGRELSDAEKACFASHYSLWQKCVALDEPLFVLEDDLVFSPEFLQGVTDIQSAGYEYVRLAGLFGKGDDHHLKGNFFLTFAGLSGAQGYYITPRAARQFIENCHGWFCPVDDYLDLIYLTRVPVVVYVPHLVAHGPAPSTISLPRAQRPPKRFKLVRKVYKLYRFLCKMTYLCRHKRRILRELSER